jgi:methyl-accepting chemotaxis protein
MKLRAKLLVLPSFGGLLMIGLCVLVTLMMQRSERELGELADVRFARYADAYVIKGSAASIHADAYRLMVGIDNSKPDALAAQRKSFKERGDAVAALVADLRKAAPASQVKDIETLAAAGVKYTASLDAAIDLGSADPKSGMAAMQTADGHYRNLAQAASALLDAERALAADSVANAKKRDRNAVIILWGATLASLIAAFAVASVFNRRLVAPLDAARQAADSIAAGDLRVKLPEPPADEIGQLITALGRMVDNLRQTMGAIKGSAGQIAVASTEIAVGNNDLSQRTEQQASSLQQTSSSMEQLTGTVATNADNARQANQLALGASEVARRGGEVVEQVVSTMGEISESSRKIADIIGVIDGIAFQTNILALNAAVEAARAGEQGRGFSVVAAEVRSLAQRSAEAAREIKGLITDSVQRVESGGRLVMQAGATMEEIVTSVRRVTDIIGEISSATAEQSSGIGQVNTSVVQLDRMTQQNAALVEESAAAAESLKEQARRLAETIGGFKLDDSAGGQWESPAVASGHARTHSVSEPDMQHPQVSAPAARPAAAASKPVAASVKPRPAPARPDTARATPAARSGTRSGTGPSSGSSGATGSSSAAGASGSVSAAGSSSAAGGSGGSGGSSGPGSSSPSGSSGSHASYAAPKPSASAAAEPVAARPQSPVPVRTPTPAAPTSAKPAAVQPAKAAAPAARRPAAPDDDWEEF